MTSNQDDKQKEYKTTMNGKQVMKYLSLDAVKMFYLFHKGLLVPVYPKKSKWFTFQPNPRFDSLEDILSQWLYLKSDVEEFKLRNEKSLEEEEQQLKSIALAESQTPSEEDQIVDQGTNKKTKEPVSPDEYIKKSRTEGIPTEEIVYKLRERGMTNLNIGRKLELGCDKSKNERAALKTRVQRLYEKVKKQIKEGHNLNK